MTQTKLTGKVEPCAASIQFLHPDSLSGPTDLANQTIITNPTNPTTYINNFNKNHSSIGVIDKIKYIFGQIGSAEKSALIQM